MSIKWTVISKKATLCVQHTILYISLPLFCTTTTWNFQKLFSYTFYVGNVVRVVVHFFSLPLVFTLHWCPLAFLIFSPPLQNDHVVLPQKNVSFVFISCSKSLSPFFSLNFAGLPHTFSFSVFLLLYIDIAPESREILQTFLHSRGTGGGADAG